MKLTEAIQKGKSPLVISNTYNDRWMVSSGGRWQIYEHKRYGRRTITIIDTDDEELAVEKLIEDEEIDE